MSKIIFQVITPSVIHLSFTPGLLKHLPRVKHRPSIDVTIKAERISGSTYVAVWARRVMHNARAPQGFVRVLSPGPSAFALFDTPNLPNGTAETLKELFDYAERVGFANLDLLPGPPPVTLTRPDNDLTLLGCAVVDVKTLPVPQVTPPELDAAGVPWDGRIHSRSKTRTGRGVWVRRKAVSDIYYATVLSQIATVPIEVDSSAVVTIQVGPEVHTFRDLTTTQLREVLLVLNAKT